MDDSKQIVNETIYIQKWPDAATVAETAGIQPAEIVAIHARTEDGVLVSISEEVVTDPVHIATVNARAEAEKENAR